MRATIAVLGVLLIVCLPDLAAAAAAGPGVERLGWLEGTWGGTADGIQMEEHWTSARGGALVGMHKDVKAGRMVEFEFFRIVASDSAGPCYLASPGGRPATPFCAIEVGERRVVFENREHDYPQRILYWLENGRLHARVEGTVGGVERAESWVWRHIR